MKSDKYDIKAVIFDMDGVLADTKEPLLEAWKYNFNKYKIPIQPQLMESLILGVVQYDKLKQVITEQFSFKGDVNLLIDEAERYYREIIKLKIKPVDGLLNFLKKLRHKSIDMVVATSASRINMNAILNVLDLSSYFKYCLCSDDVTNRKPHPEVFLLASSLLKLKPDRCLVLEDAPSGIKAAKAINMVCFALTTTYPHKILKEADLIIDSYENFPWELFTFTCETNII